jgi:glycerol kinase
MAGLTNGIWKDMQELQNTREKGKKIYARMNEDQREKLYKGWKKAVSKV